MKRISDLAARTGATTSDLEQSDDEEPEERSPSLDIIRGQDGALELRVLVQAATSLGAEELAKILGGLANELDYAALKIVLDTAGHATRADFFTAIEALRLTREMRQSGPTENAEFFTSRPRPQEFTIGFSRALLDHLFADGMTIEEFGAVMARNFHSHEVH